MEILISLLLSSLAVFVTAYILPGVHVDNFIAAVVMAIVLGAVNAFVKPVLVFLTLPINILTLGLFLVVINAAVVLLASAITPGFTIDGFLWAILFSIVVSFVGAVLGQFNK